MRQDQISDVDLSKYNIIVFEGYEMTGKSHTLSQISNSIKDRIVLRYRPNWEEIMTEDVISRGNRHILGLAVVEFFNQFVNNDGVFTKMIDISNVLLIDRWVAVSYVYQRMYNQKNDLKSPEALIEVAKKCTKDINLLFIHKYHPNEHEARMIYDLASLDSEHKDIYDKFDSFEDYWKKYQEFESLYEEFYEKSGFDVLMVSSWNNLIGRLPWQK